MSRSRSVITPWGEIAWFDTKDPKPFDWQLELLALIEGKHLDDLLDEVLTQAEIYRRLYIALHGDPVPADILEKRDRWRQARREAPKCRICEREGNSTRHHFINKWILRELSGYAAKWADRSQNTIPVCIDCHRDLHSRQNGEHSIVLYLNDKEKAFAERALEALSKERPSLLILIGRGDNSVYEARLIKDWMEGHFKASEAVASIPLRDAA